MELGDGPFFEPPSGAQPHKPRRRGVEPRGASRSNSTRARWSASRPVPSAIWCRQLVPSATSSASGARRTAGKRLSSAIAIDAS
jgi:hypothetical protein